GSIPGLSPAEAVALGSQSNATGRPFFEPLLDRAEELTCHHAIDDPVVEAETHVHDVADRNRILNYNRALDDRFSGQDRRLGMIDDGLAPDRAGGAGVVQREWSILDVVPWRALKLSFSASRYRTRPVRSTSCSVHACGAVARLRTMWSAIDLRITLSFTSSSRLPSGRAGAGAAGLAGAWAASTGCPLPTAARMSSRVTRP